MAESSSMTRERPEFLTVNFNAVWLGLELSADSHFNIPLLDQLIPDGIEAGTIFTAEFDPDSQWLAVATTIAARYLQAAGRVACYRNKATGSCKEELG
jgi:hypothetical protein